MIDALVGAGLALVGGMGLFALSTTLYAIFGSATSPRSTRLGSLGAEIVAGTREWLALLVLAVRFPWDMRRRHFFRGGEHARGTAILLPGYLESDFVYVRLRRRLIRAGYGVETVRYRPLLGHPEHAARQVIERIRVLREQHGHPVDLVGHSMGGIIARTVADRLACDDVRRVVTVTSPHVGTRIAHLGLDPASEQMRPTSDFSKQLSGTPPRRPTLNLYTPLDNIVIPREHGALPDAPLTRQVRIGGAWSHISATFSDEVCSEVMAFLTAD